MEPFDLFPRWRGPSCHFLLRGGPRDGEIISMKFNPPPDTVFEYRSRLRLWRRHLDGRWRMTAEETELADGRTARVGVYDP